MIQKYFETLVAAPRPSPPQVPPRGRSLGQLLRHAEKQGTPAALFLAWLTPPYFAPGDAACDLLARILARGRTGRLQRQFAADGDAADSISVQQISRRQQSVFAISTTLPAGSAAAASRLQQIDESLAQIARDGVSEEELAIVKQWARNDLLIKTEDLLSQAHLLASYQSNPGRPASVSRDLMRYLLVGTGEIQTLARDFLSPTQRIAVIAEAPAVSAPASALPVNPFRGQI
jgi:predicted Zn-dependent peptidase